MRGKDAKAFVESVTVADVKGLGVGRATLSVIPNADGGIIDDTIIASVGDEDVCVACARFSGGAGER